MATPIALIRLVCLANSNKLRGRCIAGVELDNRNIPKILSGSPRWIRPISEKEHGEVDETVTSHVNLLDIIEFEVTGSPKQRGYQSENVYFNPNSIKRTGSLDSNLLYDLCNEKLLLFGNNGKAVHADKIHSLSYSLTLIRTKQFKVLPHDDKLRMTFPYRGYEYDLPITDPAFLKSYKGNKAILEGISEIYLCLSLGVKHIDDFHYKLIAGVMYQ